MNANVEREPFPRRLKLILEYDGTDFNGWQNQPRRRTVQGVIEKCLSGILGEQIDVISAGRTDAGVHAAAMPAHFSTHNLKMTSDQIRIAANSLLPPDVRISSSIDVDLHFHARFHASSRSYVYRLMRTNHPLQRRIAWYPRRGWDDDRIRPAVSLLPGKHSFRSFSIARPGEEEYLCDILEARWEAEPDAACFFITADRFMHHMVRGLVGALIDLGRGYLNLDEFARLLEFPTANGAVFVAPPQGLTLLKVEY